MGLERLRKPWVPKDKQFHSDAASTTPHSLARGSADIWQQLAERSLPALCQNAACMMPTRLPAAPESFCNSRVKWLNE